MIKYLLYLPFPFLECDINKKEIIKIICIFGSIISVARHFKNYIIIVIVLNCFKALIR
jgi:hypothetical protein